MGITTTFKNAMEHDGEYALSESAQPDWEAFGPDAFRRESGSLEQESAAKPVSADAALFKHDPNAIQGVLSGNQGAGVSGGVSAVGQMLSDGKASGADKERERAKRREAGMSNSVMLAMLNNAQALSDRLAGEIAGMEDKFEAEHGDAWREVIANEVLGPDEVPQRRDGESMDAYRERLEDELVEKMINPETGKAKPEYANDPRYAEYAKWAESVYEKENADRFIEIHNDPASTPEQVEAAADKLNFNEGRQAVQELATQGISNHQVAEATDRGVERVVDNSSEELSSGFASGPRGLG